jgi:hypothetical protein
MHGSAALARALGASPESEVLAKGLGYAGGGLGGLVGGGMLGHHLTKDKEEKQSMYHPNPVALAFMQRLNQVRLHKQAGEFGSPLMNRAVGHEPPKAEQVASGADALEAGIEMGRPTSGLGRTAGDVGDKLTGVAGDVGQIPQDLLGQALMGGEYSSKMPSHLKPSLMHPALGAAGGGAIGAATSGGPGGAALGALGGGAGQIATEALARRLLGLSPGLSKGLGYAGAGLGGLGGGLAAKALSKDDKDEKRSYYKRADGYQPRLLLSGLTNAVRAGGQRMLPESFPAWTQ